MEGIYLDNAATSFPKPKEVVTHMRHYLQDVGAPMGRSVYEASTDVLQTAFLLRESLSRLFNHGGDASHVVLTAGATMALNMVIKGLLGPGDHCIVSAMEHNAVMRPLMQQTLLGVTFDRIPADSAGRVNAEDVRPLIRENTKLILITHASNVCGTLLPAAEIGAIAQEYGIPFVLDAAQTAGHYHVDFRALGLSALAVPAHKGLLGPSGIGALLLTPDFADSLVPLLAGGTGSASDSEELPHYMPDRFESGTLNLPGIYGWLRGVEYIYKSKPAFLHEQEMALAMRLIRGVQALPGIRVIGPCSPAEQVAVVSLDFPGRDNAEIADTLAEEYDIFTRCGLHCAPHAHKTLGTFPGGTVRFSLGPFTTAQDIDVAVQAVKRVVK